MSVLPDVKSLIAACVVFGLCHALQPLDCCAQGGIRVVHESSHQGGQHSVKIRSLGLWSEKSTTWLMDVSRDNKPFMSDYTFSPFYAWTCIERGQSRWISKRILHFRNLSAQGRGIATSIVNHTGKSIPYVELRVRSVDAKGYPHSPSAILIFDTDHGVSTDTWPEIFPGAEYFVVQCECQGDVATAHFKVPTKRGWPHDIDLDDDRKRVKIQLTASGTFIDGGVFERVTDNDARRLVPDGERLHLTERRYEAVKLLNPPSVSDAKK